LGAGFLEFRSEIFLGGEFGGKIEKICGGLSAKFHLRNEQKMDCAGDKKILLFDGDCAFCNFCVRFLVRRDKNDIFRFAALGSDLGRKLTREHGIDGSEIDSMILIDPGRAYHTQSTAVLEITKHLSGFYPILHLFIYLPKRLRDGVYDFVAKKRYQWFGNAENCPLPTPDEQSKFLGRR